MEFYAVNYLYTSAEFETWYRHVTYVKRAVNPNFIRYIYNHIDLAVCGLLNGIFSNLDYAVFGHWIIVNNELEMMWKTGGGGLILRYIPTMNGGTEYHQDKCQSGEQSVSRSLFEINTSIIQVTEFTPCTAVLWQPSWRSQIPTL